MAGVMGGATESTVFCTITLIPMKFWKSLKAGDVIVQPAGTGHQRLDASRDLLVVGAYPAGSDYDECRANKADHDRAVPRIGKTRPPRSDPVYGAKGPL